MSKPIRLERLLSNLGYVESRRGVPAFLRNNNVLIDGAPVKNKSQPVLAEQVTVDGEGVGPLPGFVIIMHKPKGYECTHAEVEAPRVYDLLPERLLRRKPQTSTIGRLDKDTSGLLLFTDDGKLIQRLTSPKHHVPKVYDVTLLASLKGDEAGIFESGELMLDNEDKPLLPAQLQVLGGKSVKLTLTEGRYHQVKRMFEVIGNKVETLHRSAFDNLTLGELKPSEWRYLTEDELNSL